MEGEGTERWGSRDERAGSGDGRAGSRDERAGSPARSRQIWGRGFARLGYSGWRRNASIPSDVEAGGSTFGRPHAKHNRVSSIFSPNAKPKCHGQPNS
jgi:hypothetical protein